MVNNLNLVPPPPSLDEIPVKATSYSSNWSGYAATSGSSSAYSLAEVKYNEPQALGTSCSGNSEVTWAGLGGFYTGNLAQDGTAMNVPGVGQHQSWAEILPASLVPQQLYGHPGWAFIAEVNWIGGGFHFYMYDYYTGDGVAFTLYTNSYDGRTADFIAERPTENGTIVPLTNYSYINFLDAWVNGTGSGHGVGSYSNTSIVMYSSHDMADVGGLSNSGQTFTDYWHYCS